MRKLLKYIKLSFYHKTNNYKDLSIFTFPYKNCLLFDKITLLNKGKQFKWTSSFEYYLCFSSKAWQFCKCPCQCSIDEDVAALIFPRLFVCVWVCKCCWYFRVDTLGEHYLKEGLRVSSSDLCKHSVTKAN